MDNTIRTEAAATHAASRFVPSPRTLPAPDPGTPWATRMRALENTGIRLGRVKRRTRTAAKVLDSVIFNRFIEERADAWLTARCRGLDLGPRLAIRMRIVAAGTVLAGPMGELPE